MKETRIEEDLLGSLLNQTELDRTHSRENLIRPGFRGRVCVTQAGSGILPQGVTA